MEKQVHVESLRGQSLGGGKQIYFSSPYNRAGRARPITGQVEQGLSDVELSSLIV